MEYIIDGIIQTTVLEWVAVATGIMSVWYSMKENILVYPTGIVSVLIYVFLAYTFKLYADMGVNFYYFVVSVYGWYFWLHPKNENQEQVRITVNTVKENVISLAILLGSFSILYFVLSNYTDSDVPLWDSATTCFAITGMWLMARKKLENWIAWIITDLISIPLYFYKGLVLTSFQFLFFTGIAIAGYFAWKKTYDKYEEDRLNRELVSA